MKQLKAKLEEKKKSEKANDSGLLDKLNPFQAGQNLRQTIGRLTTLGTGLPTQTKQKYYLDDRFPHPPLLPVYPVARAKSRLMMHRFKKDFYSMVKVIEADDKGRLRLSMKALLNEQEGNPDDSQKKEVEASEGSDG